MEDEEKTTLTLSLGKATYARFIKVYEYYKKRNPRGHVTKHSIGRSLVVDGLDMAEKEIKEEVEKG